MRRVWAEDIRGGVILDIEPSKDAGRTEMFAALISRATGASSFGCSLTMGRSHTETIELLHKTIPITVLTNWHESSGFRAIDSLHEMVENCWRQNKTFSELGYGLRPRSPAP